MRKTFRIAIAICLVLAMVIPAYATTDTELDGKKQVVLNEYDLIVEARQLTPTELESQGYEKERIRELTSTAVEEELLYRKSLSSDVLINSYGYSKEQVDILKSYEGTALEDTPEIRSIFGELTFETPNVVTSYSRGVTLTVSWEWDICPTVTHTDAIGISWLPTFGSQNGTLRLSNESYHKVRYRAGSNTDTYRLQYDVGVLAGSSSPVGNAQTNFPMRDDGSAYWAVEGTVYLYLVTANGSADLTSVDLHFNYGHCTLLGVTPSISYPLGFGISWESGCNTADAITGYIDVPSYVWHPINTVD